MKQIITDTYFTRIAIQVSDIFLKNDVERYKMINLFGEPIQTNLELIKDVIVFKFGGGNMCEMKELELLQKNINKNIYYVTYGIMNVESAVNHFIFNMT